MIRPYRPEDRAALFDVCVKTGDAGQDAAGQYEDDDLLPVIFLAPYLDLEPGLAFVHDAGDGPSGYVVGCADTADFVRRFRTDYLPTVAGRFPPVDGDPTTPTEGMRHVLHHPERMVFPELAGHPAHLHIDLLPAQQRQGHGRELIAALLGALRERGVPGVHLSMLTRNTPARAFYDRLGFTELPVSGPPLLTFLGRNTEA